MLGNVGVRAAIAEAMAERQKIKIAAEWPLMSPSETGKSSEG